MNMELKALEAEMLQNERDKDKDKDKDKEGRVGVPPLCGPSEGPAQYPHQDESKGI